MALPFDDMAGSAVLPVARTVADPEGLLDDLELRLARCSTTSAPLTGQMRIGAILPAGTTLHRIANVETRGWWNEHALTDQDAGAHHSLLDNLLARSPRVLGWAAVPLLGDALVHLLDSNVVMRVIEWVTSADPVERLVRDAVALSVLVPWLEKQTPSQITTILDGLCRSENVYRIRIGLLATAAIVRAQEHVEGSFERASLDACWLLANRVDVEIAIAVGWVLRELVFKDAARVFPEVLERADELSRQAVRTAGERLPMDMRRRLTARWMKRIARRSPRLAYPHLRSTATLPRVRHD